MPKMVESMNGNCLSFTSQYQMYRTADKKDAQAFYLVTANRSPIQNAFALVDFLSSNHLVVSRHNHYFFNHGPVYDDLVNALQAGFRIVVYLACHNKKAQWIFAVPNNGDYGSNPDQLKQKPSVRVLYDKCELDVATSVPKALATATGWAKKKVQ